MQQIMLAKSPAFLEVVMSFCVTLWLTFHELLVLDVTGFFDFLNSIARHIQETILHKSKQL